MQQNTNLGFRQLFDVETSTYTYLLFDPQSREAVLIDPVLEQVERDLNLVQELNLKLIYTLDTHVHADHITGAASLREKTGAKVVLGAKAAIKCADVLLQDQEELHFGAYKIQGLATPGHTDGCTSFITEGMAFTGDALFIRTCGRTDFQQGNPDTLFESIQTQLYSLPEETVVYPGHDYKGLMSSTIGEEKEWNIRIPAGQSKAAFKEIMDNLNLPYPKKLEASLPANLQCGKQPA